MGSGVIGITTAYMLAKDGHKVRVIDCASEPARECSYANGAQLSFSHIEPISSRSSLRQMSKAAIKPNSFLSVNTIDKSVAKFAGKLVRNSNKNSIEAISRNIFNINKLSKKSLGSILKDERIRFDHSQNGILHIFRDQKYFEKAKQFSKFQNSIGDESIILNLVECVEKEPTLIKMIESRNLKGGIFHPGDESGNPYLFCKSLARICREKYGVEFIFNERIKNILTDSKKITGINCVNNVYKADSYIYSLGASGLSLLKGIEIETGILPILGSSVSIEVDKDNIAPKISLTDSENRLVYSRIGTTFRAAGGLSIQKSNKVSEKMGKFIRNKIASTFSSYGDINRSSDWQNYRPIRPSSTPLVCKTNKYDNLYLNTGHGHLGWTMSCGTAEIIRRLVAQENTEEFSFLNDKELR